MEMGVQVV